MTGTELRAPSHASGCADLSGVDVADDVWDSLYDEALMLRRRARTAAWSGAAPGPCDDGAVRTAARPGFHPGGAALRLLHVSKDMLAAIGEVTGLHRLSPHRCDYRFYRAGDFLGVHRDSPNDFLTVVFGLTDDVSPISLAPAMREATEGELAAYVADRETAPTTTVRLPVEFRSFGGFHGHAVPHWSEPYGGTLGIAGTMSYSLS
jgi:hypothetical protein